MAGPVHRLAHQTTSRTCLGRCQRPGASSPAEGCPETITWHRRAEREGLRSVYFVDRRFDRPHAAADRCRPVRYPGTEAQELVRTNQFHRVVPESPEPPPSLRCISAPPPRSSRRTSGEAAPAALTARSWPWIRSTPWWYRTMTIVLAGVNLPSPSAIPNHTPSRSTTSRNAPRQSQTPQSRTQGGEQLPPERSLALLPMVQEAPGADDGELLLAVVGRHRRRRSLRGQMPLPR